MCSEQHSVLLGGIGGDSHSVGIHVLNKALIAAGYDVYFMGIQNQLESFFTYSDQVNVVMISSMDGHARQYLNNFAFIDKQHGKPRPLWYLGGNLTIGYASKRLIKYFKRIGFDRAYPDFVDVSTVLDALKTDLRNVNPIRIEYGKFQQDIGSQKERKSVHISKGRKDLRKLLLERKDVLSAWPTGKSADCLDDNASFLKQQRSFPNLLKAVESGTHPMVMQLRSGTSNVSDQKRLFTSFKEGGVHAVSYQVDSLTRNNNYQGAAAAINENALNGFPIINHGVDKLREIAQEVRLPIQTRHSTKDPRLLAELSYAGGVTAFEGGSICYNIPYYKNCSLRQSIEAWKYVDRLTGYYFESYGVTLDREFFGTLTATLLPPCIPIATNVLEALLASEQGVKCVSLGYAEQGNRVQDIAAIRAMEDVATKILKDHGHADVDIYTVFHQYMAAFPSSSQKAEQLIISSATTAALSNATRLIVKSPVESQRIPTVEDNLKGLALVSTGIAHANECHANEEKIKQEMQIIRREALAIIGSVLECGRDNIETGIIRAFDMGYLDVPFSPSVYTKGAIRTARDTGGAVRFLDIGNLQFDIELRDFHENKMLERGIDPNLRTDISINALIENDILQIAREEYTTWPLDSPQNYGSSQQSGAR